MAGAIWLGLRYWGHSAAGTIEYKTSSVTRGDVTQIVTANGSLNPVQTVEVGSQISGVITRINVDFNSRVKAGDIVAQIDPATYERAQGQAEAELASAEAAEELAQLNYDRGQELFNSSLISKSDFDQLRVSLRQAKAQVKTRRALLESAQVDLSRTTIHAPIDGVVITRKVEAGQTVAAAMTTPTLFTIANDLHKMQIEAAVSEADIGGIQEGQKVQFTVDAFPGRLFEGSVRQVRYAPSTNQNVVTYSSIVEVDNKDLKLRPGMTANARFITAERKDVLKIPLAAIRFHPPAGVTVVGQTNEPTTKPAGGLIENGPFKGLPVMPWMAERRMPTEAERTAYVASLNADQKQQYEKAVAEFRARMAQGGGFGGGGGGGFRGAGPGGGGGPRPQTESTELKAATVYLKEPAPADSPAAPVVLRAVAVKLGISDSGNVEVLEGLKENDQVVSGTFTPQPGASTRNPFSPFGGPPRR
ncbi:MAG TPA: efflux RND transporter periplasmic adaptor subunit [Verrucomicrobiae bacterium]|nr:efflux RND transporter periplasmic adaptor subunit [Verrucomicrobiae bacterium]